MMELLGIQLYHKQETTDADHNRIVTTSSVVKESMLLFATATVRLKISRPLGKDEAHV